MSRMNLASTHSRLRGMIMILLAGSLFVGTLVVTIAIAAQAQSVPGDDPASQKEYWQSRYRGLRQDEARLERNIVNVEGAYAEANRRNYRRGKIRHVYQTQLAEARTDLAKVRTELAGIVDEGRRAGAMPAWFYEVEDEPVSGPARPAARDAGDQEDDGRNPLYKKKKDD